MSYRLISRAPNQFELILEHEPHYIFALPMAPVQLEDQLRRGNWLVLVFAVWSATDTKAIQTAIDVTKQRNGQVKLGIRPFDRHEELNVWMPESRFPVHNSTKILERGQGSIRELFISSDRSRNPIWLYLKNGKLIGESAGPLTKEALEVMVKTSEHSQ